MNSISSFQIGQVSTKNIVRMIIVGIFVLGTILNLFTFWTIHTADYMVWNGMEVLNKTYCVATAEHMTWIWAMFRVTSFFIPSFVIIIITILIIIKLKQMSSLRRKVLTKTRQTGRNKISEGDQRQLNIMLLLVAITFLVLRLPKSVMSYRHYSFAYFFAMDVAYCLAILNYCINFFLFCLSGSLFRKALFSCLKCKKVQRQVPIRFAHTPKNLVAAQNANSLNRVRSKPTNQQQRRETHL